MFSQPIGRFRGNLDALREFVDVIEPFLEGRSQDLVKSRAQALVPLVLAIEKLVPGTLDGSRRASEEWARAVFDGEIHLQETEGEDGKRAVTISVSGKDAPDFHEAFREIAVSFAHKTLLYESSLVNLTSAVEWFLADIVRFYFDQYPEAVGARERMFSLEDLRAFSSIDDAKQQWREAKVSEILRGSFDDWIKFLRAPLDLSMNYIEGSRSRLAEVFQRRNLLVHNGGIVNYVYLSKVDPGLTSNIAVGDKVQVDYAYLTASIDLMELNFILVCAELWKKIKPDDDARGDLLNGAAFDHLMHERWSMAEGLSRFVASDKRLPERAQLVGRVNYWQSVKWQGRYEEVRHEVEQADFSAKDPMFHLALCAVADNEAEFFALLPDVMQSGTLSYPDLDTWPVFREMRSKPQYARFRKRHARKFPNAVGDALSPGSTS